MKSITFRHVLTEHEVKTLKKLRDSLVDYCEWFADDAEDEEHDCDNPDNGHPDICSKCILIRAADDMRKNVVTMNGILED